MIWKKMGYNFNEACKVAEKLQEGQSEDDLYRITQQGLLTKFYVSEDKKAIIVEQNGNKVKLEVYHIQKLPCFVKRWITKEPCGCETCKLINEESQYTELVE